MSKTIKLTDAAKMMGTTSKAAAARLKELGCTVACARCGGSGRYSYNQIDGDRCWGCDGRKAALAPLTEELVRTAIARIEAGELADYFARIAARRMIKPKLEAFWAAYMAAEPGKAYSRLPLGECGGTPEARAMELLNAAHDWAMEAEFGKTYRKGARDLDPVTACAHIDDAIAAIALVCRSWAARS